MREAWLARSLVSVARNQRENRAAGGRCCVEHRIHVVTRDAHYLPLELTEDCPLFWLCVDVCPHLLGGTVFNGDLPLVDFVFNVKILNLDVLGTF